MPHSHAIATCKYVHVSYGQLINKVYTLNYVSHVYNGSFGKMKHPSYWPEYKGPPMRHNREMQRIKKDHPNSIRIRTKMD